MGTVTDTRPVWVTELLKDLSRPVSDAEKARRARAAARAFQLRDTVGVITLETTDQYIREIREGEAARA